MVVVPAAIPVANPEVVIVAAAVLLEVQVADTVPVVPSEKLAVAVNCCVEPGSIVPLLGETVIELTTFVLTVRVVDCVLPLFVAVIVVLPTATALASPDELMVATAGFEDVQLVLEVISLVVPSPKTPLAENCCVAFGWMEVFVGLMVNDAKSLGPMKKLSHAVRESSRTIPTIRYNRLPELRAINR